MNDNVDINDSIDNNNICDYGSKNKKTSRTRIFFPNKYIYSLNKYDFGLEKNILFSNTIFFFPKRRSRTRIFFSKYN
jgi:hypothetical protein